ncbi:B2 protein-like [Andrographis paniculata]|uniref:B2 protein-like n=1 Tax=Andrographis paniculata TaxID=175694 RepID=UPI0021E78891|nr:B2 protein-like [Andrographis paniculata]
MESNNQTFWQFSDDLRLQTGNLSNLSLNDSIWSSNYVSKKPAERRNFDFRNGGGAEIGSAFGGGSVNELKSNWNLGFNNSDWKSPVLDNPSPNFNYSGFNNGGFNKAPGLNGGFNKAPGLNGGFNKGIYSNPNLNFDDYIKGKGLANVAVNSGKINKGFKNEEVGKKKNRGNKESTKDNNSSNGDKTGVDKRFKTLPPAEALPRNETIGGYIFVCNNDTMAENLKRQLFGLPSRYRDSVRAITPGLPLFLYNYSTHQLHGVFEASSFGGANIDPTAWEDKKNPGESRFPAQVRVMTRKLCEPLEEDSFRPILHHYDGPKFRLELNIPEALSLLDIFEENNPDNQHITINPNEL